MAVFSTNQNRQLYVAKSSAAAAPEAEGALYVAKTPDGQVFFQYKGKGGALRSDLIDINSVVYAKYTKAEKMQRKLKKATIKLDATYLEDEKPIAGQDYIVKINIYNYIAPGDGNVAVKYGSVHATKGMTASQFYSELAESLTKNFSKEVAPMLTFTGSSAGVEINEVEQPWNLGTMASEPVNFEVYPTTIIYDGEEVNWAQEVKVIEGSTIINNGKKIADLEYFCMGERGDQYRNQGWPNVIPTAYMVDASQAYDVIDIHYSFSDTGVNSQKSEKDIIIVGSASVISAIAGKIKDAGIAVEGVAAE